MDSLEVQHTVLHAFRFSIEVGHICSGNALSHRNEHIGIAGEYVISVFIYVSVTIQYMSKWYLHSYYSFMSFHICQNIQNNNDSKDVAVEVSGKEVLLWEQSHLYMLACNLFVVVCCCYCYWSLAQRHNCGSQYQLHSFHKLEHSRFECEMVWSFYDPSAPSMSRLAQPKWRSVQSFACLLCFSFPHVQSKIRLVCLSSSW